jgi:hypothetical protein
MQQCFAEAKRLGRSIRWGETGPILFTRIAEELGYSDRALPNSMCYPVHHSEILDILRPSMYQSVSRRTDAAYFVHIYNQMLKDHGVQKTLLPPQGSILRRWIDQYPAGGWMGEYDEITLDYEIALQAEYKAVMRENGDINTRLQQAMRDADASKDAMQRLQLELSHSREQVLSLYNSSSWRLMAPLRAAYRLLGRLKTAFHRFLDRPMR